jgi:hypothetical protein
MIKEGNDHFEVTKAQPHVDVCEKHYVFDARTPPNATPITFHPREKCPIYEIPPEIAGPVKAKHDRDEREFAEYAKRGIATAAVRTGTDGGMHPAFLAKVRYEQEGDRSARAAAEPVANTTLPPNVNPPHEPGPDTTSAVATAPAPAKPKPTQFASTPKPADAHPPAKPQPSQPQVAQAAQPAPPATTAPSPGESNSGLISGAAAVVPAGSFEGRWGGMR